MVWKGSCERRSVRAQWPPCPRRKQRKARRDQAAAAGASCASGPDSAPGSVVLNGSFESGGLRGRRDLSSIVIQGWQSHPWASAAESAGPQGMREHCAFLSPPGRLDSGPGTTRLLVMSQPCLSHMHT